MAHQAPLKYIFYIAAAQVSGELLRAECGHSLKDSPVRPAVVFKE